MPDFTYQGINKTGRKITGRIQAETKKGVLIVLRQRGLTPTSITELKPLRYSQASGFGSVSVKRLAAYTRQFAQLSKTDIPLSQIFEILAEDEGMLLCEASAYVARETGRGRPLPMVMGERPRVFSKLYIKMVDAGLQSGTLDRVAEHMAKMYEAESAMRIRFTSKMVYPGIVLVLAFFTGLLLSAIGWIPKEFVMALMGFWLIIICLLVFGMTRLGYRIYREIGFRLPWIGSTMRKINLARFCRIFGLQYAAGVPMLEGLETSKEIVQDGKLQNAISRIQEYINEGTELREAMLMTKAFPAQMVGMVGVGERAGGIDLMLEKLAEYYELDADAQTDRMATVAAFIVFIAVAVSVGIVVILFWSGYFGMINDLIDSV